MNQIPVDSELAEYVRGYIHSVWGSRDASMFPGPHPVSIERSHISIIKQNPYVVCEKTDGIRFMLVCVRFKEQKVAVFVNRAMNMFSVRLAMPSDTIIDGELVGNVFMVYDGIIINNEHIGHLNLIERLKKTEIATKGPPMPGIRLKMKTMWALRDFKQLSEQKFDYETDGYIFTPVNEPIRMETHETMFKWKPLNKITVDFMLKDEKLYVWDRKHDYVFIQHMYGDKEQKILECSFDNGTWVRNKVRKDKVHPNNRRTFLRTMVNIRENIQPSEFYS